MTWDKCHEFGESSKQILLGMRAIKNMQKITKAQQVTITDVGAALWVMVGDEETQRLKQRT